MKKEIIFLLLYFCTIDALGGTSYIPIYHSYISIYSATGDTIKEEISKQRELIVSTKNFDLCVIHEAITKEKVRSIKSKKRAAKWMAVSSVLSSISSLSSGSLVGFEARLANARVSSLMSNVYAKNARTEQVLKVQVQFQNRSEHEMIVADTERGLVWYVKSGGSFCTELSNPDVAQFRIGYVNNSVGEPVYATLCGGSTLSKMNVIYEDEDYWVAEPIEVEIDMYQSESKNEAYIISKEEGIWQHATYTEYQKFVKDRKTK